MTLPEPEFGPSDVVISSLYNPDIHNVALGVVVAREWYETLAGGVWYYYVRWCYPEGHMSADLLRHTAIELDKPVPVEVDMTGFSIPPDSEI